MSSFLLHISSYSELFIVNVVFQHPNWCRLMKVDLQLQETLKEIITLSDSEEHGRLTITKVVDQHVIIIKWQSLKISCMSRALILGEVPYGRNIIHFIKLHVIPSMHVTLCLSSSHIFKFSNIFLFFNHPVFKKKNLWRVLFILHFPKLKMNLDNENKVYYASVI